MKRLWGLAMAGSLVLTMAACEPNGTPAKSAVQDPVGAWGSRDASQPWLNLDADGTVTGNDGCNILGGQWTKGNSVVDFGALAGTEKHCEGIDDWLSGASSAKASGDIMTILDAKGHRIGTLDRSE